MHFHYSELRAKKEVEKNYSSELNYVESVLPTFVLHNVQKSIAELYSSVQVCDATEDQCLFKSLVHKNIIIIFSAQQLQQADLLH